MVLLGVSQKKVTLFGNFLPLSPLVWHSSILNNLFLGLKCLEILNELDSKHILKPNLTQPNLRSLILSCDKGIISKKCFKKKKKSLCNTYFNLINCQVKWLMWKWRWQPTIWVTSSSSCAQMITQLKIQPRIALKSKNLNDSPKIETLKIVNQRCSIKKILMLWWALVTILVFVGQCMYSGRPSITTGLYS
jgi:hypothetical protein